LTDYGDKIEMLDDKFEMMDRIVEVLPGCIIKHPLLPQTADF
jgi:hypothetical protein